MTTIPGLHHVTAIAGQAQANVAFYTGILQQRLVKKTVNFDAPDTYHLYYGDAHGSPGTILTFFPFAGAIRGRAGAGMARAYAYAVPHGAFGHWVELAAGQTGGAMVSERFGTPVLTLQDPDGAPVELIATDVAADRIGGFHSVTLWVQAFGPTVRLLTEVFGYAAGARETREGMERLRLTAPGNACGNIIDLVRKDGAMAGKPGAGTIHHVAFRARTNAEQEGWIKALEQAGYRTTQVIDRQYFKSIYFREPGGVLFEIATDAPGFGVDEPAETMGQALMLPAQHEHLRARLEQTLPALVRA